MHTDSSLKVFDHITSTFGDALRFFAQETCVHFATVETDSEYGARSRALQRRFTRSGGTGAPPSAGGKQTRTFNLVTIKWHALGDYPTMIPRFGTTDVYNTQTVRLLSHSGSFL